MTNTVTTVVIETRPCIICGLGGYITVPADEAYSYAGGALAQEALVSLTAGEREQIISGTHPKCWDLLDFGDE